MVHVTPAVCHVTMQYLHFIILVCQESQAQKHRTSRFSSQTGGFCPRGQVKFLKKICEEIQRRNVAEALRMASVSYTVVTACPFHKLKLVFFAP